MNWYKKAKLSADSFCRGYCAEFAIALHKITKWTFVVFNEVFKDEDFNEEYGNMVHVALKSPNGKYADVRGLRTEQEIANNLLALDTTPLDKYKIEETTENDLYASTEIFEEAIDDAKVFISKNKKLWNIK